MANTANRYLANFRAVFSVLVFLGVFSFAAVPSTARSDLLNLPDFPLFMEGNKTALVQLIVERDNKLFFEAYPSYEDINGDGVLDNRYKPLEIDYYGYFESTFCYTHNGSYFQATSLATNKKCLTDPASWSGDYLNFLTMTRMDIMLRALIGGRRVVDTATQTVLRRAFVPWENHTWGIEYESPSVDGYLISDYSPLATPASGKRHHLATNNYIGKSDVPYLRIRLNSSGRIWDWVDQERTQGDGSADLDITLDVEACRTGYLEETCSEYPNGGNKPTGILHEYGENNRMYFSLLTGSFENNLQGGVLRQSMRSFGDEEVDPVTGIFSSSGGIAKTLTAIQIPNDYKLSTVQNDCGWISQRPMRNGECRAWGNPVAEMMYEGLRYLAGEQSPTPSFFTDSGMDQTIGLPTATWDNPYSSNQPYSQCSSAYQLVISDPSPSFDGDQLPGSAFSNFTETSLGSLDVGTLADFISGHEAELPGLKFIGESNGIADGSPSPKQVTTFRTIRGQSPEAPHRQGSYYAPSVAYYGSQNDMQPNVPGDQSVDNFTLALGSPLPTIDVEVGSNTITFAPFAKTVGSTGGCETSDYKPTNALVGFVVEDVTATSGSFRVSFEDMEQGADNDMDALGRYEYEVSGNDVTFEVTSLQASGCYIQHFGYTVSGSNNDGVYLVVRDADTSESTDPDFALDVPPGAVPGSGWDDGIALPLYSQLIFSPSTSPAAETLKSPLWYAAKWGGFNDINGDGVPQLTEWDSNGDGEPDNYFKVTDPSKMVDTLRNAFNAISEANASASSVGVTSGSLTSDSHIYETSFRSGQWYGELFSRAIDQNGNIANTVDWSANDKLTEKIATGSRTILTYKPSTQTGIPFRWPIDFTNPASDELDLSHVALLSSDPVTDMIDSKGSARLDYIRGVESENFRTREKPLGDIISSNPQIVGPPVYYYPDDWGVGEPETNAPYSTFGNTNVNRQRVVYVGANDGMLHAFDAGQYNDGEWDAGTGNEIFAYVPAAVYKELPELASKRYGHKFYVDATPRIGDAIINNEWQTVLVSGLGRGGQGIFALNVTDVGGITEATADDVVMWEFTDADDADVGYTYSSPLIARMHNGKWAAIFGNGFNATQSDGSASTHGKGAIFIVDLETGTLIRKLLTNAGDPATPNAIKAPTALDLDNDNIIDIIYAGDLAGQVSKYDVRSSSPSQWSRIGDDFFQTSDQNGSPAAITAEIAAGSHPTGEGILVYLTSGKYLEPSDQENTDQLNRIYALWDKQPFSATNVTANFAAGQMLQQSITTEKFVSFDSDHDGNNDSQAEIRESTELAINWEVHYGWYMNLNYPSINGERAITPPLLRENKVLISTQIPQGDSCTPEQDGWLMILDAASGSMPGAAIDLDGNGSYTEDEILSGMRGLNNPLASPTIVSSQFDDTVLTNDVNGEGSSSSSLDAITRNGRISWRELEP